MTSLLRTSKSSLTYRVKSSAKTSESVLNLCILYCCTLQRTNFSSSSLVSGGLASCSSSSSLVVIGGESVAILVFILVCVMC